MAPAAGRLPSAPSGRRKSLAQATLDSVRRSLTGSRPATAGPDRQLGKTEPAQTPKQGHQVKRYVGEGGRRNVGDVHTSWSQVMPLGRVGGTGAPGQGHASSGGGGDAGEPGVAQERRFWSGPQRMSPAPHAGAAAAGYGTRIKGAAGRDGNRPAGYQPRGRSGDEARKSEPLSTSRRAQSGALEMGNQISEYGDRGHADPHRMKRVESARVGAGPRSAQVLRTSDSFSAAGAAGEAKGSSRPKKPGSTAGAAATALTRVMSVGSASKRSLFEPPSPSGWVSLRAGSRPNRRAPEGTGEASPQAKDDVTDLDVAPSELSPTGTTHDDLKYGAVPREERPQRLRATDRPGQRDVTPELVPVPAPIAAPVAAPVPHAHQEEPRKNLFEPPRQGAALDGEALGLRRAAEMHARWGSPTLRTSGTAGVADMDAGPEEDTLGAPAGLGERTRSMTGLAPPSPQQLRESSCIFPKSPSLQSLVRAESPKRVGDTTHESMSLGVAAQSPRRKRNATTRKLESCVGPSDERVPFEGRRGAICGARRCLVMPSWSDSDDEESLEHASAGAGSQDAPEHELRVASFSDLLCSQALAHVGAPRPSHEPQDGVVGAAMGGSDLFAFQPVTGIVDPCQIAISGSAEGQVKGEGAGAVLAHTGADTAVEDQLARLRKSTSALRAAMQFMKSPSGAEKMAAKGSGHADMKGDADAGWMKSGPAEHSEVCTKGQDLRADECGPLGESSHDAILSSLLREPSLMDLVGLASGAPGAGLAEAQPLQSNSSAGSAGSSRRFMLRQWDERRTERSSKGKGGGGLDEQAEAKAKFRKDHLEDPTVEPEDDTDLGMGTEPDLGFQFSLGWTSGLAEPAEWAVQGQHGSAMEDQGQYAYDSVRHPSFWGSERVWRGPSDRVQSWGPGHEEREHWKGKGWHAETEHDYSGPRYTKGVSREWKEGHEEVGTRWEAHWHGTGHGSWRETARVGWDDADEQSYQDDLVSGGTPLAHLRREFEMMQAEGLMLRWNERDGENGNRDSQGSPAVHQSSVATPHRVGSASAAEDQRALFRHVWGLEDDQQGLAEKVGGGYRDEMHHKDANELKGTKESEEWREKMQKQLLTKWFAGEGGMMGEDEDDWVTEKCQPVSISQRKWNSNLNVSRN